MKKLAALLFASLATACSSPDSQSAVTSPLALPPSHRAAGSNKIQHVVVIVQENRSFDNIFYGYPGANTATSGMGHGKVYDLQPQPLKWIWDLRHDHPQFLEDFDNGKLDGFDSQISGFKTGPACRDAINHPSCWTIYQGAKLRSMAYSYVRQTDVQPYWAMASQYTLGDNTFSSNNGPSFVSHQYLVAGQSGHSSEVPTGQPWGCDAPSSTTVELLAFGPAVPPEFSPPTGHEIAGPYPCFSYPTVAGLLDNAGITWRYYVAPPPGSGSNLSAFDAIAQIREGPDWANVVTPDTKVLTDIANGQLQQVSWVMPTGSKSDHAGRDSGAGGPDWVASIVNAIGQSSYGYWQNTAIIVMWDECGGWYDHVKPLQLADPVTGAYEGLGFRVPLLVISPYAKVAYVSHQRHEIASSLHFIEKTFGLPSLGLADARADAFADVFNFSQPPVPFKPIPTVRNGHYFLTHPDNSAADSE
jgi:phospholipase C